MAPIPACAAALVPKARKGLVRTLEEDEYWRAVFPSIDSKQKALSLRSATCTGKAVFEEPFFSGASPRRGDPMRVESADLALGNGGDRLRIAWMRTHRFADGTEAGPVALVRAVDDTAEVYAIGLYRGAPKSPVIQVERIGYNAVVTITEEGCRGDHPPIPCTSAVTVFLPHRGTLLNLATFALEKRAHLTGGEPGVSGRIEYRLTASPSYTSEGIKVFEQLKARDEVGREVRSAEQERWLLLRGNALEDRSGSVWARVFPGGT
jgi:hypothetical protein